MVLRRAHVHTSLITVAPRLLSGATAGVTSTAESGGSRGHQWFRQSCVAADYMISSAGGDRHRQQLQWCMMLRHAWYYDRFDEYATSL